MRDRVASETPMRRWPGVVIKPRDPSNTSKTMNLSPIRAAAPRAQWCKLGVVTPTQVIVQTSLWNLAIMPIVTREKS